MPALLAADAAAVLLHILVNVLVAHGGLGVVDAQLVKGLVQAKVGHDGGDHRVGDQLAPLLHIAAIDIQDVVAGDHVALLVHAQAAVGVAVVAANRVVKDQGILQIDLFTDTSKLEREKSLQATMLGIKKKFGKNAVLKGTNYLDGATMRERNGQIGGHKAK